MTIEIGYADTPRKILEYTFDGDDHRVLQSTIEGGVRAAVQAVRGDADAVRLAARPWDAEQVIARMYDVPPVTGATVLSIATSTDPQTVVVDVGESWRLLLRSMGGPEDGEWRLARILPPGEPIPLLNPEDIWLMNLPEGVDAGNDLRWLCFVLQDVSELLGDGVVTMPGERAMKDETVDVGGQGETKSYRWSGWSLGHGKSIEVESGEHEIFDGATPRWGYLRASALHLDRDAGMLVNASLNAGETALVRIQMTAPPELLTAALDALRSGAVVPGSAVL